MDLINSPGFIIAVIVLLTYVFWHKTNHCGVCKARLFDSDRMSNGAVRYRIKDTNIPVCRHCGNANPRLVE